MIPVDFDVIFVSLDQNILESLQFLIRYQIIVTISTIMQVFCLSIIY